MSKFFINLNGELLDESTAKISVLDRGFLYGDSVYEATRTFNRTPFRLDQHIERLFDSASKIYFSPKTSRESIKEEAIKTLKAAPFKDASIRIVLSRGTAIDLGLDPSLAVTENLIIYVKELKPNPSWWYNTGVKLGFYQKETSSKGSLPKTGNYIENMLANRQAIAQGFYDSIMINNDGHITECTTSNIWIVKKGIVYTPSLDEGVLPGLTRSTILNMPRQITIIETKLTPKDVFDADECFITSTTREVVPVTEVEHKAIGNGTPGPITLKILHDYRARINEELKSISSI